MSLVSARAAVMQALISGGGFGLDLIERIRAASGGAVVMCQGAIYPALRDLEREGLVRGYPGEPHYSRHGGRPRVNSTLTPKGRKVALATRNAVLGLFGPEEEGEGVL